MAVATFFALLTLKTQMHLSSSAFQMTFLAMVVYEVIAVFGRYLVWWQRVVGLVAATTTYILVFAVIRYVLVEVYAQSLTDVFWGVGIADDIAFVVGAAVQLTLMYRWQGQRKSAQATPHSSLLHRFSGVLKVAIYHLCASLKAASPFQVVVMGLLLTNTFLSYQAWDTATEAVWQATDAGAEARSAAGLANDALEVIKQRD